jgi:hypothetical protein
MDKLAYGSGIPENRVVVGGENVARATFVGYWMAILAVLEEFIESLRFKNVARATFYAELGLGSVQVEIGNSRVIGHKTKKCGTCHILQGVSV